jgi:hypothetical protein
VRLHRSDRDDRVARREAFAARVEEAVRVVVAERRAELERVTRELDARRAELDEHERSLRARAAALADADRRTELEERDRRERAAREQAERERREQEQREREEAERAAAAASAPLDLGDPDRGRWRLAALERIAQGVDDPGRAEQIGFYLEALRPLAGADGLLPASVDGVVAEAFGDLLSI